MFRTCRRRRNKSRRYLPPNGGALGARQTKRHSSSSHADDERSLGNLPMAHHARRQGVTTTHRHGGDLASMDAPLYTSLRLAHPCDDERAAFNNQSQWLRSIRRFTFAVWSTVAANPWLSIAREVVTSVAPMYRPHPCTGADAQCGSYAFAGDAERSRVRRGDDAFVERTFAGRRWHPPSGVARFALTTLSSLQRSSSRVQALTCSNERTRGSRSASRLTCTTG